MLKSGNTRIKAVVYEDMKSHEKGKRKIKTRASWTHKPPPPSTSLSSDVWEIPPPAMIGRTTLDLSSSGFVLDLLMVNQHLEPVVGRAIAPYTAKMRDSIGRSVSELTSEKWAMVLFLVRATWEAVNMTIELSQLRAKDQSLASKNEALPNRVERAEAQIVPGAYMTREKAHISLAAMRWMRETPAQRILDVARATNKETEKVERYHLCCLEMPYIIVLHDLWSKDHSILHLISKADMGKVTRSVISMSRGEYFEKYPFIVDIGSGEGISATTSHSQEFAKIEVYFAQIGEGVAQDAVEADPEPRE
uniref:Uncharacterized protein n=1 Tax=Cannabis sativa TaxID=3483 RepID=A0A803PT69_CANSA